MRTRTKLQVVGLAAGENTARFVEQVTRYRPRAIAMASADALAEARSALGAAAPDSVGCGAEGLVDVATHPDADVVLFASSGTAGLEAVLAAIDAGKTIALANKEDARDGGRARDRGGPPARASPSFRSTASTTRSTSACTGGSPRRCGGWS